MMSNVESIKNDTAEIELCESSRSVLTVLRRLAECDLSKTDIKVLELAIFTAAQSQKRDPCLDFFEINKTFIANVLDMKRPNVSRSVKKLVDAELLKKNTDGTYRAYYF